MVNSVVLVGRITRDLELKRSSSGVAVLGFTLAVDDSRKNPDGSRKANFIPCTAIGNSAELIDRYCSKGSLIAVSGQIQSRQFQTRDGQNRTSIDVLVSNFTFCGAKSSQNGDNESLSQGNNNSYQADNSSDDVMDYSQIDLADDDLPF